MRLRSDEARGSLIPETAGSDPTRVPSVLRRAKGGDDMPGQMFLNFSMSWNRLRDSGSGIAIPIMSPAMANESASQPLDDPNEVDSLHGMTNSPSRRTSGISPLVRSR